MLRFIAIVFFINFKDTRNIALMTLLPILLTLILGTSLSSVFNENTGSVLSASKWLYEIEDTEDGDRFLEFLETYSTQLNMELVEQSNKDAATKAVSNLDVDGYLVYMDKAITVYKNEYSSVSVKWLEIVFDNYLDRASIIEDIVDSGPDLSVLQFIVDNAMDVGNHIELLQIESIRQPDAIGYYAIAMITLTCCYSIVVLILALYDDKRKDTLKRILMSGKSFFTFLFCKSFSICLVLLAELSIVMLFDALVYRVYFGDFRCAITVLAVCVVFTYAVTQLGTLLCLIVKNIMALNIVINAALLPAMLFLGGAYLHFFKLISIGLKDILVYSPVYHINKGLFDAIYLDSYDYITQFLFVVIAVSVVLTLLNMILSKWRGNSWAQ